MGFVRARKLRVMALGLVILGTSTLAAAQPVRTPRVGVLGPTPGDRALMEAFLRGLALLGYVDGRTVIVDNRHAGGNPDGLPTLATELVRANCDVIIARGAGALAALKSAAGTTPIVAVDLESDPVAMGYVRNLARPGGSITGVFLDLPELSGKQLQILREVIPKLSRVAVLGDPILNAPQFRSTETAAKTLAMQAKRLDVKASSDLEGALGAAKRGGARAVLLLSSPLVFANRAKIASLAEGDKLPAVSMFVEFVEAGGFMAYGPSIREAFRRAGNYTGRILQGAKPGELPVERPEKFDLVINMRTAKALGLVVPPAMLKRADRIIE